MAWRFRKSFSPLPGIRLTLSPSGISTSVGISGFRISSGPSGMRASATIPGTGLRYEQRLSGSTAQARIPAPTLPHQGSEVASAGSEALTTAGLAEFEKLLRRSFTEREEIGKALAPVTTQLGKVDRRVCRWDKGFLFKRWFPKKLETMRILLDDLRAQKQELDEQNRLARLAPEVDIPPSVTGAHERLTTAFSKMAQSQRIWDTVGERAVNQVLERSAASRSIQRKPVTFSMDACPLLEELSKVPHMQNANGGDLYLFPAFIVYFISRDKFALLEYSTVRLSFSLVEFIEASDPLPTDAEHGGGTWLKVNKNGSPDQRFKDNRRIPTAIYGQIALGSEQGLREEYMVSNHKSAGGFEEAWNRLVSAVTAGK